MVPGTVIGALLSCMAILCRVYSMAVMRLSICGVIIMPGARADPAAAAGVVAAGEGESATACARTECGAGAGTACA